MFSTSFPEKSVISRITAKMLIEVEAVRFSAKEPFKFTSGWASPVYIDCRKLISYPKARSILINFCSDIVVNKIGLDKVESLVGGETAGIPFASFLASKLELPMHYVRKKQKSQKSVSEDEKKILKRRATLTSILLSIVFSYIYVNQVF